MNDPNYTPAYKFVAENADSHAMSITPPSTLEGPVSPRVCGLRRRTFWILTTVVALVVVCSIIGGVAGGLASRKKDTAPAAGATGAATAENTTTTAASQVPTSVTRTSTASGDGTRTTLLMTPTQTLLSDCPSSNNTIYSVQQDGNILSYVKFCGADIGRNPDKHLSIHQYTDSLDDCIKLCADPPEKASGTGRDPCRAVCWRNTRKFGVGAGFCYGFAAPGAKPANHWLTDFDAVSTSRQVFRVLALT
jgi:hypothetical protein